MEPRSHGLETVPATSSAQKPLIPVELAGEECCLSPHRAVYWPREKTLFIADLHWGKMETFRAAAIPLPSGCTEADLRRLSLLLAQTEAERLIILGDLLHARAGRHPHLFEQVEQWRREHAQLAIGLIRGNHDRRAGDIPAGWNFDALGDGLQAGPFHLCHEPVPCDQGHVLAGHLHPAVRLQGEAGQRIKVPCFWLQPRVTVLPAFSLFVDGLPIRPAPEDRILAVTPDAVIPVANALPVAGVRTRRRFRP